MNQRRCDGFFYGLFMDVVALRELGVEPLDPRPACVEHFALRIGQRATLLPSPGARAYGMVIALTHAELDRLYSAPGLDQYRAEAVVARLLNGGSVAALCYNLLAEPRADEKNPDYAVRLQKTLQRLGCFPAEYVDSVTSD
jgi:hypothetical protein